MITFFHGSGSPFGWRVWLSLEHKEIPYELRVLSFDKRETKTPEYLAINPRGRVPSIVHDGFAVRESAAIVEYLEDAFPRKPLIPRDAREAARVRMLVREIDSDYGVPNEELVEQILYGKGDTARIAEAHETITRELERWNDHVGDWLASELSAADFALYPLVALTRRMAKRASLDLPIGERVAAWMKRVESLPYFDKTYPSHWR